VGLKSVLIKPFAISVARRVRKWAAHPRETQEAVFSELIRTGSRTSFGKEHGFDSIRGYDEFRRSVPLREYEAIKPYIERIKNGEEDVLWPGKPKYFAKTSGTTSGTKYIPLTADSIPNHINSARNALFCWVAESGDASVFDGKMIFVTGSPKLEVVGGIKTGRLSGIVNHEIPGWVKGNRMPTYETNCIEDWEQKIDAIVEETLREDMRLISGIPPWVLMYYDKLIERTGQRVGETFPNYKVFMHGGVNFEPYREPLERAVGKKLPVVETYPASEGFMAFTDSQQSEGLLLNVNSGIFFEFVPASDILNQNPQRLALWEIQTGVNYAIIINNNAGLWGYDLGDTVRFVSTEPYRLVVTGRTKQFISAFGEHVIAEEIEGALVQAARVHGIEVSEFHVAPQVNPPAGEPPYHEWFVEALVAQGPPYGNHEAFATRIDELLQQKNSYYKDLRAGNILQRLKLHIVPVGTFRNYMRSVGKLGGQNKVPHLANDRSIADQLKV
jgi:hypothetical protein